MADETEKVFWYRCIAKGKQASNDLDQALEIMERHGTLETTRLQAIDWSNRAKQALEPLPPSDIRDMLTDLADYVVSRLS